MTDTERNMMTEIANLRRANQEKQLLINRLIQIALGYSSEDTRIVLMRAARDEVTAFMAGS